MTRFHPEHVKSPETAGRGVRLVAVAPQHNAPPSLAGFALNSSNGAAGELKRLEELFKADPKLTSLHDKDNILAPEQISKIDETLHTLSPILAEEKIEQARRRGLVPPKNLLASAGQNLSRHKIETLQARGYHQSVDGLPCQDTVLTFARLEGPRQVAGAVVNDGVSCIGLAHLGSRFLALVLKNSLLKRTAEWPVNRSVLDAQFLGSVHADVCFDCVKLASNLGLPMDQAARLLFGSTTQVLLSTPYEMLSFGLADGYFSDAGRLVGAIDTCRRPQFEGSALPPPLLLQALKLGYGNAGAQTPLPYLAAGAAPWKPFLGREAASFYVYFYRQLSGCDNVEPVVLASDGVRHVSGKNLLLEDRRLFPIDQFRQYYRAEDLPNAVALWNLAAGKWRDSENGKEVRDALPKVKKGRPGLPEITLFADVLEYREVDHAVQEALGRLNAKHSAGIRDAGADKLRFSSPLSELALLVEALVSRGHGELRRELAGEIQNIRQAVWSVFEKQFPKIAEIRSRSEICRVWDDVSIVQFSLEQTKSASSKSLSAAKMPHAGHGWLPALAKGASSIFNQLLSATALKVKFP